MELKKAKRQIKAIRAFIEDGKCFISMKYIEETNSHSKEIYIPKIHFPIEDSFLEDLNRSGDGLGVSLILPTTKLSCLPSYVKESENLEYYCEKIK